MMFPRDDSGRLELTDDQISVMNHMLAGETTSEAAAREGITPAQMRRWMDLGSNYEEIWREKLDERWSSCRVQLLRLLSIAVCRLTEMAEGEDDKLALQASKEAIKFMRVIVPKGFNFKLSYEEEQTQIRMRHVRDYYPSLSVLTKRVGGK